MKALVAFLLLVVIVAGAWAAANFMFDRSRLATESVAGAVREIVVDADRGDIDLVPARRLVEVRETRHWALSEPELERTRRNGVLTLKSTCGAEAVVMKCYADLRVSVPAGVKVTVEAGSGDVDLRSARVSGVHAESDRGDVELDLDGSQRLVWARSDSGRVDVVAASARAVDARTRDGDVNVELRAKPRRVVARTDSGAVDVVVPRGRYTIKANRDSGGATISRLRRDGSPASTIRVRARDGDVEVLGR